MVERIVASGWGKFMGVIADLNEHARRQGWQRTGPWLIKTLARLPYHRIEYTVFARSLRVLPSVTPPARPVTLRLAEAADLDRFVGLTPPSELRYFRQRLAHGRLCFLALDGENLAAYCWAATEIDPAIDVVSLPLQPGDAYLSDAYTVPGYRRQGIQQAVHLYRLAYMRDRGCQRALLIVEDDNAASQRLVRKLGYRPVAHLSFRRILWKQTFRCHPAEF